MQETWIDILFHVKLGDVQERGKKKKQFKEVDNL